MGNDSSKLGAWTLAVAFTLIFVVPGLLLYLLIYKPFTPAVQTAWYAFLAIAIIGGALLHFIEFAIGVISVVRKHGIMNVTFATIAVGAIAYFIGINLSAPKTDKKPTSSDPIAMTTDIMDQIYHVIRLLRATKKDSPTSKNMAEFLNLYSGDPHKLAKHFDKNTNVFLDAWDNPILYERGAFDQVSLQSFGPNGQDDQGSGDDIIRGDLIVVNLNPKDKIIDGVKGLLSRDKDDEEKLKENNPD